MSRSIGATLAKGLGLFVLAVLTLGVIATIAAVVLGVVATIVSVLVTVAVLGLLALAGYGLFTVLRGDSSDSNSPLDVASSEWLSRERTEDGERADHARAVDPEERLRDRYLAGEIDEDQFERRMERLLDTADVESVLDEHERERDASRSTRRGSLDRLLDR